MRPFPSVTSIRNGKKYDLNRGAPLRLKWKSDDYLTERPRRRLHLASGTVVKSTRSNIFVAFFDTESDREEIAVYSNTDPSDNQAQDPKGFAISVINTNVFFDAYQLDPQFPIYSEELFVTWIATKVEFKSVADNKVLFVSNTDQDHFSLPGFDGKFLKNFEVVPTSYSGHMEFYGYFKSEEGDFNRFMEDLKVSCSFRSTTPQRLAVNRVYAMPVLLEENEDIPQKKLEKMWTRVKCIKIINRKFILGDLLETGETSRKVLIKNLIIIPDYIGCHPVFVKRFHFVGCRSVKPEDFNGDVERHDQALTRSYKFLQGFFEENDNIIKCHYGFINKERILIDVEYPKTKEKLTYHVLGENYAYQDPDSIPDDFIDDFLQSVSQKEQKETL